MPIGRALRGSVREFYFNSWRLAPANVIWGVLLLAAIIAGPFTVVGAGLIVALGLPTAGIYRMAALIARDRPAAFADFVEAIRRYGVSATAMTLAAAGIAFMLTTNVLIGFGENNPIGWFLSAMALWGLVGLAMFLTAFWPLLVDPERDGSSLRATLRLAAVTVIGRPVRVVALTLTVGLLLGVSTVLFAALVMVSVAYVALVSSRVVLPLVDEVEARLPEARRAG